MSQQWRLISGFARGIPREYVAYGVDLAESRARFEEAWEIIKRAWTEEVFSDQGKFWSYKMWPSGRARATTPSSGVGAGDREQGDPRMGRAGKRPDHSRRQCHSAR